MAKQLVDKEESKLIMETLIKDNIGVICVKVTDISESESDTQGVLYSFPRTKNKSVQTFLTMTKGAYITLNHLLSEMFGPKPIT